MFLPPQKDHLYPSTGTHSPLSSPSSPWRPLTDGHLATVNGASVSIHAYLCGAQSFKLCMFITVMKTNIKIFSIFRPILPSPAAEPPRGALATSITLRVWEQARGVTRLVMSFTPEHLQYVSRGSQPQDDTCLLNRLPVFPGDHGVTTLGVLPTPCKYPSFHCVACPGSQGKCVKVKQERDNGQFIL